MHITNNHSVLLSHLLIFVTTLRLLGVLIQGTSRTDKKQLTHMRVHMHTKVNQQHIKCSHTHTHTRPSHLPVFEVVKVFSLSLSWCFIFLFPPSSVTHLYLSVTPVTKTRCYCSSFKSMSSGRTGSLWLKSTLIYGQWDINETLGKVLCCIILLHGKSWTFWYSDALLRRPQQSFEDQCTSEDCIGTFLHTVDFSYSPTHAGFL